MEVGINAFGNSGDPAIDTVVANGGFAMVVCPACVAEGREPHMLSIQKHDGRFVVTASPAGGGADNTGS
jgi:hypothetical protein